MKRIMILFIMALFLVGCGKTDKQAAENKKEEIKKEKDTQIEDIKKTEQNEENTEMEEKATEEVINGTIYYVDGESAEIVQEAIQIENEYDIWNALITKGILADGCELLRFEFEEESNALAIDINKSTGDRIRSMGTTGEIEILTCLINSYLDTFNCEKIKIKEEGNMLETSHGAEFSDYVGRMDI